MHPGKWLKSPLNGFDAWFSLDTLPPSQYPAIKREGYRLTLISYQRAKLRPSVTAKKKTKKPLRAYRFRFCLISSVIRINLARAIKAMSLFIIKPVYRVKSLIEEVTLSLKS
jgi:hypothetical protein